MKKCTEGTCICESVEITRMHEWKLSTVASITTFIYIYYNDYNDYDD